MADSETPEVAQVEVIKPSGNGGETKRGGARESLGIPAKFLADDLVKAVRVLNDKGGTGTANDLQEPFGGRKRREILVRALSFSAEIGLAVEDGRSFSISDEGKRFLSSADEDKRGSLARRLASFGPYRDVFLRLQNEREQSLKKANITEMWSHLAGGGRGIREEMTKTFASLASFAVLVNDTGRTCVLLQTPEDVPEVPGQEATGPGERSPAGSVPGPGPLPRATGMVASSLQETARDACPKCLSNQVGVLDEEPVQYFADKDRSVVLVKYKLFCRACKESFARLGQQGVPGKQS